MKKNLLLTLLLVGTTTVLFSADKPRLINLNTGKLNSLAQQNALADRLSKPLARKTIKLNEKPKCKTSKKVSAAIVKVQEESSKRLSRPASPVPSDYSASGRSTPYILLSEYSSGSVESLPLLLQSQPTSGRSSSSRFETNQDEQISSRRLSRSTTPVPVPVKKQEKNILYVINGKLLTPAAFAIYLDKKNNPAKYALIEKKEDLASQRAKDRLDVTDKNIDELETLMHTIKTLKIENTEDKSFTELSEIIKSAPDTVAISDYFVTSAKERMNAQLNNLFPV